MSESPVTPAARARWLYRPDAGGWACPPPRREARTFHSALPGYAETPLVDLPTLAGELGVGRVMVKDESSRLGLPAFKILGASWAVARLLAGRAGRPVPPTLGALAELAVAQRLTLVTASAGNHGRAVARVAALLGLPAQVFVPPVVPTEAVAAIEGEGAVLTTVDGTYDEAVQQAAEAATAPGAVLVQDTAWPGYEEIPGWIVEGYATLLLEVDGQLAARGLGPPDVVAVGIGVGSLAQAVIAHYRSRTEQTAVMGVEPDTAACVLESLCAGEPRSVPTGATKMAGLNAGTPSSLAWPYLREGLDAAVAVSDADADRAVADLGGMGVSSGPCGAASLAGVRAALTGPDGDARRADLGLGPDTVVVLLSTEGRHPQEEENA